MAKTAQCKTAGQLAVKAASDKTSYSSMEVGHALCDDVLKQLWLCIDRHKPIINEEWFTVVMVTAGDPLIKNMMRRKFYAWPYLPSPRPHQAVFLYRRSTDDVQYLWSLPDAATMAELATLVTVDKAWKRMKFWCDAFFSGHFHDHIRWQHGIVLESEREYLDAHRQKLIEAGCKPLTGSHAEAFDFSKIQAYKVGNAGESSAKQGILSPLIETKATDGDISLQKS